MSKLWNTEIPGTCNGRTRNLYMAYLDGGESTIALARGPRDDTKHLGLSAFSNLCISLYPTLLFWNLQMKTMKKVFLCLLFGMGVMFVCILDLNVGL